MKGKRGKVDWNMKRKIYTSRSVLHFNVGGTRIAFIPLSSNSSYFETKDETLQKRIETHPWFGDKFVLKEVEDIKKKDVKNTTDDVKTPKLEERSFSTLADAKEWLANEYGVARSNIKRKEDAVNAGLSLGVKIVFEL